MINEYSIVNNQEKINALFLKYSNIVVDDSNYKAGFYDSKDYDVYVRIFGHSYCLRYNDVKNEYILLHKSTMGYDSKKHRYHFEWSIPAECGLKRVIYMISTRHNPKIYK